MSEFLRPLASVRSLFATSEFAKQDISYDAQFKRFLEAIYDPLSTCSEDFKSSFTSIEDLSTFTDGLFTCADELMNARMAFYDKDATSSVQHVGTSLKKIPELKPDEPDVVNEFVSAVRHEEKLLLQHCELLHQLLTSVDHDATAFACEQHKICSMYKDS